MVKDHILLFDIIHEYKVMMHSTYIITYTQHVVHSDTNILIYKLEQ